MAEVWQIIKASLKNKLLLIAILTSLSVFLLWTYAALMPTLQAQMVQVNELMKAFPPEFLKAFNADSSTMSSFASLLATKQYGLMLPIFLIVLATAFNTTSMSGEIENGTIQLYLANKISRQKYYWSKYLSGIIAIFVISILSILPGMLFAEMYNLEYDPGFFYAFTLLTFIFGIALFSLGHAASAFFSNGSKVVAFNTAVFIISYLINVIAALTPDLDGIKFFSLFYYFNPGALAGVGSTEPAALPLLVAIALVSSLIGYFGFLKRDISIR